MAGTASSGWRALLTACVASVALIVASPAHAQAPLGPSVFYNVTYEGTGQFTVDGQSDCSSGFACFPGPWHVDAMYRHWTATFPAVQLSLAGASTMAPAAGQELSYSEEKTDTYCPAGPGDTNHPCQADHAVGDYAGADPGAPSLVLTGQFTAAGLVLKVDAPWIPDPAPVAESGGSLLPEGLYAQFPDALRAVTTIPVNQLDTGTITQQVSSQDPGVYQLPPDCTAQAQADDSDVTSCSQTMLWRGTVTITPDCVSDAARVGGASQPPCVKKQHKDQAQSAARDYQESYKESVEAFHGLGCGPGASNFDPRDTAGACAADSAMELYDGFTAQYYQHIADDPPGSAYAHVAHPHAPRAKGLGTLRRFSPATYRLMRRYLQVAGLASAVMTSQNRATGAFLAFSSGKQAAGGDVAVQDHAVLAYAGQAVRLLAGQHRLALRASAELRRIAASIHGRGSRGLTADVRRLASSLVSRHSRSADRLAMAALSGIGR